MVRIEVRVARRTSAMKMCQFFKSENLALCEHVAEQFHQVLKASLIVQMYVLNFTIYQRPMHIAEQLQCLKTYQI